MLIRFGRGVDVSVEARLWSRAGFLAWEVAAWRLAGCTVDGAVAYRGLGFTPNGVGRLLAKGPAGRRVRESLALHAA